jgi:BirA family transcriptional regulator, biotin operon repressor / biotin---[acetyl-CoA-carboxylase] ligase
MSPLPPILLLDEVGSTNDLALDGARGGAMHGACWAAEHQVGGRGRREPTGERRVWHSPAGVNIAASVLLRLRLPPTDAAAVTLGAAVAAAQVVERVSGVAAQIKWPNDLYVGDRKLAGILTEAVAEGGKIVAVVVGIGINVNLDEAQIPAELAGRMTSLRIVTGGVVDRQALLVALRAELVACVGRVVEGGLEVILPELRARDALRGHEVSFLGASGEPTRGVARGIDGEGRLVVDVAGVEHRLSAGEVNRVRREDVVG